MTTYGAGALRERVTIQAAGAATPDGGGGAAASWTDVATVWAQVSPVRGGEQVQALALQAALTHRVRIRHRTDVSERNRLLWGAIALNIRAATNPDERRIYTELLCEQGVVT